MGKVYMWEMKCCVNRKQSIKNSCVNDVIVFFSHVNFVWVFCRGSNTSYFGLFLSWCYKMLICAAMFISFLALAKSFYSSDSILSQKHTQGLWMASLHYSNCYKELFGCQVIRWIFCKIPEVSGLNPGVKESHHFCMDLVWENHPAECNRFLSRFFWEQVPSSSPLPPFPHCAMDYNV